MLGLLVRTFLVLGLAGTGVAASAPAGSGSREAPPKSIRYKIVEATGSVTIVYGTSTNPISFEGKATMEFRRVASPFGRYFLLGRTGGFVLVGGTWEWTSEATWLECPPGGCPTPDVQPSVPKRCEDEQTYTNSVLEVDVLRQLTQTILVWSLQVPTVGCGPPGITPDYDKAKYEKVRDTLKEDPFKDQREVRLRLYHVVPRLTEPNAWGVVAGGLWRATVTLRRG